MRLAAGLVAPAAVVELLFGSAPPRLAGGFLDLVAPLALQLLEALPVCLGVGGVGAAVAVLLVPAVHRRGPGKVPGIVLRRRPAVAVGRLAGLGNDRPALLAEPERDCDAGLAAPVVVAVTRRAPANPVDLGLHNRAGEERKDYEKDHPSHVTPP